MFNGLRIVPSPVLELTHSRSHLHGENARQIFILAVDAIHPFSFLSFHQLPITAGWPEALWIKSFHKASIHDRAAGNRSPDPSLAGPTTPLTLSQAPVSVFAYVNHFRNAQN